MNTLRPSPHARGRDGVALVLAMVILAALLLLGLPLLFSQSASVSGARSFADNKISRAASLTAQNIAIDAAARAIAPQLVSPLSGADSTPGTCLPWAFNIARLSSTSSSPLYPYPTLATNTAIEDLPWFPAGDDGSMALNSYAPLFQWQQSSTRVAISARFSDEAGKFDPNHMSAAQWSGLFTALNIPDWYDRQVMLPYILNGNYYGNLAIALSRCRMNMPGGRITELEQLLTVPAIYSGNANVRNPLTRAELERLRPYLTLWNPQPGRGIIDLGTVVANDQSFGANTSYLILDSNSTDDQDFNAAPYASFSVFNSLPGSSFIGEDTILVSSMAETDSPTPASHARMYGSNNIYVPQSGGGGGGIQAWGREFIGSGTNPLANTQVNSALAIEAPPALNIHHLPTVLRQALSLPGVLSGPPLFYPASLNWVPRPFDDPALGGAPSLLPTPGSLANIGGYSYQPDNQSITPATYTWTTFNLFARRSPLGVTTNPGSFVISEIPPLTVASPGVWSIEAASTVSDASGNETAQDLRRAVVQAVPQERLLEWHWSTQAEIETMLGQRFGSHVQSWPYAWQRRIGGGQTINIPQDTPDSDSATDPSTTVGLRPAPLTDITAIPPPGLAFSWMVDFGGAPAWLGPGLYGPRQDANIFNTVKGDIPFTTAPATTPNPINIRPDGYHIPGQDGAPVAYSIRVGSATSPFTTLSNTTTEMDPLQVSFWFSPETTWTGSGNNGNHTVYTLCQARTPDANAAPQINGRAGSGENQNGWALYYDVTAQMLVLTTASPVIEHDHDEGWIVPSDDPTTPALNESATAASPGDTIALSPQCISATAPLVANFPMWTPGRALHIFRTPDDPITGPYFRAHQWYHVQLALTSDRPEEAHIIVDGICGQDMAKKTSSGVLLGDHETLPTLVLATTLPYLSSTSTATVTDPASDMWVDSIAVTVPGGFAGLNAENLLPARGIVRIDDEYISYGYIDSSHNLRNCLRGVRQNTNVSIPYQAWPTRQQHDIGALVVGGGYRLPAASSGTWYRGGCTLVDDFDLGDPNQNNPLNPSGYGTVWGSINPTVLQNAANPIYKVLPAFNQSASIATPTNLTITDTAGVDAQFPKDGGIIHIHNNIITGTPQWLAYDTFDGTTFTDCYAINTWNPALSMAAYTATGAITFDPNYPPIVSLVGIKITGKDALVPGRYYSPSPPFGTYRDPAALLQFLDPANGGIEWVGYDHILDDPVSMASYVENDDAWYNRRGQQRTALRMIPAGGRVIPVQSDLGGGGGHMIATGDCLTLMPVQPLSLATTPKPFQVVVRYAATDGFNTSVDQSATNAVDCKNEFFALTDAITADNDPMPLPGIQFEILCAPCWSGVDLTGTGVNAMNGLGSDTTIASYPPRLEMFNPDLISGAAWYLGGADPNSTLSATAATFANPDITLDQIATGRLHPSFPPNGFVTTSGGVTVPTGIMRFFVNGAESLSIPTGVDIMNTGSGLYVEATQPIFSTTNNAANMGLIDIDGEVFAYQQPGQAEATIIAAAVATADNGSPAGLTPYSWAFPPTATSAAVVISSGYFAKLVARNLLHTDTTVPGSEGYTHTISDAVQGEPKHRTLPATLLPLGPVWQLASGQTITDGQFFQFTNDANGDTLSAVPAIRTTAMVIPQNGDQSKAEMLQLLGPDNHQMYGIPEPPNPNQGKFTTARWLHAMYNTVLSATTWSAADHPIFIGWWPRYASSLPADSNTTIEQFRSRSFSWVGYPVTIAEGFFWPKLLQTFPPAWQNMHMAEVTNIDDRRDSYSATSAFTIEARALTAKEDDDWSVISWRGQAPTNLSQPNGSPITALGVATDASDVFDASGDSLKLFSDGTQAVGCHGAELRITWHYTATPSSLLRDVANAGNLAPAIGSVRIRGLAPVTVLANRLSP